MPSWYEPVPYKVMPTDTERLSDVVKVSLGLGAFQGPMANIQLSAHVTRLLGQNPGMMTLQGTNSYILQPPSNALAPIILIDTSSPHTASQYVDLVLTHLYSLGLSGGARETHFESKYAKESLEHFPEEKRVEYQAKLLAERAENPRASEVNLGEYGDGSGWAPNTTQERRLPPIEHIILTHRHLDHVGAVSALLAMLKSKGLPKPKIWKMLSPDELELGKSERDRPTTDAAFVNGLPKDSYIPFQPLQPIHPLMPGLMLSLIDPEYKYLVEKERMKWNDIPEIARVSVRCLKTPGHTADSVALVMCEGERGVFTGDTVLGQGTTIFTDLAACELLADCIT
jgi:glyoxylase-like metal-dependent hydrolase (beta-lactamase superfamily II)